MEIKQPKVTLVSHTMDPLETLYVVWASSKGDDPLLSTEDVKRYVHTSTVRETFRRVIAQRIPLGEHLDFVFILENVSVSWREQAVRHRIGVTTSPERLGVDMVVDRIPELADSSFWSQSMRLMDMGTFASNGAFRLPNSVLADEDSTKVFTDAMFAIQRAYSALVQKGIPMEDARELIPLGAQHRISWRLNVGSLQHIIGHRTCWILQLGLWGPVIKGMVRELVSKVDGVFSQLTTPPCIKDDEFISCIYEEENRRRYAGLDRHPPCPLHFRHHHLAGVQDREFAQKNAHTYAVQLHHRVPMVAEMRRRASEYSEFWMRDPYTGRSNVDVR